MQFINDASTQNGGSLLSFSKFYSTKTNPSIKLNSNSGIYNPSDNVIKIFTNNTDALTINANQQLSGNGIGLTNLNYNAITNAPTLFSGSYNDLSNKPTLFSGSYNDLSSKPDLSVYATNTNLNNLSTNSTLAISNLRSSQWTTSGTSILYTGGNIGIGTAIPVGKLTIQNSYGDGVNGGLCLDAKDATNNYSLKLHSFVQNSGQVAYNFQVNNITSSSNALVLGYNGNIGIGGVVNPLSSLSVKGVANIHNGSTFAASNNYMKAGSLIIGDILENYGTGGNNWSSNTAGLLMECLANTEIMVHDANNRLTSLIQYNGDSVNTIVYGRGMTWGYPLGHYFNAENVFNVYINGAISSWNNLYIRPTSLWGDGLTTASETAGTKYITMGYMMFQNPHIVPATVGGDALIRIGRAGGITTGVYWEIATKTNGNFNIGKESSTTIGLNITPSGNVGIGIYSATYKLDVNGTLNATSIYNNGVLLTTTLAAKEDTLTFSAPLTRTTNTISLDLSGYATTSALAAKENTLTFSAPLTRTSNTISLDLSSYDTIALRNTALSSYLTSATASTTYATITNLNAKENVLTFSAPLTRTTNTISLDLSGYATTSALAAKENTLTFSAPLTRTTNTISLDLSSYDTIALRNTALSSYLTSATASTTYATITNLNAKENVLTFSAPLTRTTNTISLDLSGYATTSALAAKENVLTFTSPLTRTGNTITFNSAGYATSSQLSTGLATKQDNLLNVFVNSTTLNIGIGTGTPQYTLQVLGYANIFGSSATNTPNNTRDITAGTLTIGDTGTNYSGTYYTGGYWTGTNTAGLLMECLNNTEIVVHDYSERLLGLIGYLGGTGTTTIQIGRDKGWGNANNINIECKDWFNVYFANSTAGWRDLSLQPTSLWGDALSTASEYGGTKYLTMRQVMFQSPHVVPSSVGGDAIIRIGRAGGIQSGTWWELATKTNGNFNIGKEASTTTGLCINTSGNVGIGTASPNSKLHVYGAMNICCANPYAIPNGYNTGAGCLTIGDISTSYGGSINSTWGTNMGLFMETLDNTEIAIHDAGTRLASFLYYSSAANAIYIGRNMGWGASAVAIPYYLHVFGSVGTSTENSVFVYYDPFQSNGSIGGNSSITIGLIVESRAYFKSSAIYVSDERIKMNIQDIDDDSALQKILLIKPKTYEYIDKYNKGNGTVYGFISQQIREIIPKAVSLQSDFIPNILSLLQCSGSTIITNEHTNKLNVNDEIKLTSVDNNEATYKIKEINENKITIDKEIEGDKCFVYGKKINDFHASDKNYIYTLNVSATQELLIQQQYLNIQDLQNRILILENKNI